MSRRSRRARAYQHHDKYAGYSESYTPYIASDTEAQVDPLPEITLEPITSKAYMSACRPQDFSSTSLARLRTIEQTLGTISQDFSLDLKTPPQTRHGLTLLSQRTGQDLRKQLRQEGRNPSLMRESLFRAMQKRLGSVASKPLIVFAESVQVYHKEDSNTAQINILLGATAKREMELVNDAVKEVCGHDLRGAHLTPRLNLGSIAGSIDSEVLTALRTVEEVTFEPLRFGPIRLPEGYPAL